MGKKSSQRDARIAAARARDAEHFQRGTADAETIAFLASHPEQRIQQVIAHAVDVQAKPMAEGRAEALQVLGAAAALARARTQSGDDAVLMLHPEMGLIGVPASSLHLAGQDHA